MFASSFSFWLLFLLLRFPLAHMHEMWPQLSKSTVYLDFVHICMGLLEESGAIDKSELLASFFLRRTASHGVFCYPLLFPFSPRNQKAGPLFGSANQSPSALSGDGKRT